MALGHKTGGRKPGSLNKLTVVAKDAIAQAFDRVGGVDGLVKWIEASDDNRKVFYSSIHTKIIPLQLNGPEDADGNPTRPFIEIRLVQPGAA